MDGDIVVQRCVHATGTQPVGNCPQYQRQKGITTGKTEQPQCGQSHAACGDLSCAEAMGDTVTAQTGKNGSQRDHRGDEAGIAYRDTERGIHKGPCRPQQCVREPETDKGKINNNQKKMDHIYTSDKHMHCTTK